MGTERRDWAWRWSPAIGPIALTLRFAAPSQPPLTWFAARPGHPYRAEAPARWRGPTQSERGELLLGTATSLTWLRSFHTPPEDLLAFDAGCLEELIDGALGPFEWDLIDEDFFFPVAAGDDPASFVRYLEAPPEELEPHYAALFTPLSVDARSATSVEDVLSRVSVSFDRWFETHTPKERPRVLHVHVPPTLGSDWSRRIPGHERLLISIRYG